MPLRLCKIVVNTPSQNVNRSNTYQSMRNSHGEVVSRTCSTFPQRIDSKNLSSNELVISEACDVNVSPSE